MKTICVGEIYRDKCRILHNYSEEIIPVTEAKKRYNISEIYEGLFLVFRNNKWVDITKERKGKMDKLYDKLFFGGYK